MAIDVLVLFNVLCIFLLGYQCKKQQMHLIYNYSCIYMYSYILTTISLASSDTSDLAPRRLNKTASTSFSFPTLAYEHIYIVSLNKVLSCKNMNVMFSILNVFFYNFIVSRRQTEMLKCKT